MRESAGPGERGRGDPGEGGDRDVEVATFPGSEAEARERLCRVGRQLHEAALLAGRAGNLSVRLDAGRLLVTPRGRHKGRLAPGDLVVVPLAEADRDEARPGGAAGEGAEDAAPGGRAARPGASREAVPAGQAAGSEARATSELPFHRAVYRARPDVAAAVHTHAPALTAAGVRGLDVTAPFPEIEEALGALGRVPFRPSGSRALAEAVEAAAAGADVLVLERHGTLAVGATPREARDCTELAELTAWAALLAEDAGLGLDLGRVAELHRRIVERQGRRPEEVG